MYKVVVNYGSGKVVFEAVYHVPSKEEADTFIETLTKDRPAYLEIISMGYEKIKEAA
jgi:hypothetical protein